MKEKLHTLLLLFTHISTSIFLINSIALIILNGSQAKLFASEILAILGIALLCSICYIPFLSDKSFSKTKMILMQIAYFAVINIIVLTVGHFFNWFYFTKLRSFCFFEAVIVFSYLLVMFMGISRNSLMRLSRECRRVLSRYNITT